MNVSLYTPDYLGSEDPRDPNMSSFARSFKPSPFLSPRCRPSIGRTFSNSSDLSITSNNSARVHEEADEYVTSAPNTPGIPALDIGVASKDINDASSSPHSVGSRPIAIELPSLCKVKSSSSARTPPEPLSARGYLPGGYFPLHENPKERVHRPHPFHKGSELARHKSITLAAESSPMHDRTHLQPPATAVVVDGNMPVASYYPAGFHDTPLPMGKYYPSNYEHRAKSRKNSHPTIPEDGWLPKTASESQKRGPSPSTIQSPTSSPQKASKADIRRQMEQYRRDMVAQATMALGLNSMTSSSPSPAGLSLKGLFPTSSPHLHGPKLEPLGSPGPVTPMELESGGSYMDKGKGPIFGP